MITCATIVTTMIARADTPSATVDGMVGTMHGADIGAT